VPARVVLLDGEAIPPGGTARVQLVLERPIGALWGDRLVLRDTSAQRTIGGGHVLDPSPPQRRRRTPERLAVLDALAAPEPDAALGRLLDLPPGVLDLAAFGHDRNLTAGELQALASRLSLLRVGSAGRIYAVASAAWTRFGNEVGAALAAFHAANADQQGIATDRLRTSLPTRLPAVAFAAMLQALQKLGKVAVEGGRVRLPSHSVRLTPADERLWSRIEPLLRRERFKPPRVRDLAGLLHVDEAQVRRLLKMMMKAGRVDEIAHDHFFLRAAVSDMARIVAEIAAASAGGEVAAAALRDRLDNGRKVAIQVLEHFDRHGLTVRKGDLRSVRADRLDRFVTGTA
jgi:selenocysteine-specific elongation factor